MDTVNVLPLTRRGRTIFRDALVNASTYRHDHVGVEHLLLALCAKESTSAVSTHTSLADRCGAIHDLITSAVTVGPGDGSENLPQTPNAKQVLIFAIDESRSLGHTYVNSEHLLLGLLRLKSEPFVELLVSAGTDLNAMRSDLITASEHDRPNTP